MFTKRSMWWIFVAAFALSACEADPADQEAAQQDAGGSQQDAGGSQQDAGGSQQDAGGAQQDAGGSQQDAGGSPDELGFTVLRSDRPYSESAQVEAEVVEQYVLGLNDFAFNLYNRVAGEQKNLIFSPLSIHQAMAMTWAGARGQTAEQIAQGLSFSPQAPELFHPAVNALSLALAERAQLPAHCTLPNSDFECGDPFTLRMVNAVWGQEGYGFLESYLDLLSEHYDAGLNLLNFLNDPEGAREIINAWVEAQTNDRIVDLLPEGVIKPVTRMVLTNAIYFKASWATPFEAEDTQPRPFAVEPGRSVDVETMRLEQDLRVSHSEAGVDVVRLPYAGEEVAMWLIAPPLGQLEPFTQALDAERFAALRAAATMRLTHLYLPKFSFESDLNLKEIFREMGVSDPFVLGVADFSGIDGTMELAISDALHKAFIGIDEEGTEAAAATAVIFGVDSAPADPIELHIDRPFLMAIVDEPTGAILFLGQVGQP